MLGTDKRWIMAINQSYINWGKVSSNMSFKLKLLVWTLRGDPVVFPISIEIWLSHLLHCEVQKHMVWVLPKGTYLTFGHSSHTISWVIWKRPGPSCVVRISCLQLHFLFPGASLAMGLLRTTWTTVTHIYNVQYACNVVLLISAQMIFKTSSLPNVHISIILR